MARSVHEVVTPPLLATSKLEDFPGVEAALESVWKYLDTLRSQIAQDQVIVQEGSATYDPANLVDGAGATTTVTVSGAVLGDMAFASFSLDLQGITMTAYVSVADTVSVRFQNETGGAVDLGSGTLRAGSLRWKVV